MIDFFFFLAEQPVSEGGTLNALDNGFGKAFLRAMFNPLNPFLAGAASALSVVAAQTAWWDKLC
jgi:hypothetical protein